MCYARKIKMEPFLSIPLYGLALAVETRGARRLQD